jgi:photosystem II stability/assembly factor-like uncharacterized protein
MKTKLYFIVISIFISIAGNCQFIPMNINFEDPSFSHYPEYISIIDASTVWLGVRCEGPYSKAIHTNDGGTTWNADLIPTTGFPIISSAFALDANTSFYVFTDNGTGGSIWKTTDGGMNWVNKVTTQFTQPGGFANFYYGFDANEGVAMGDPTLGYFEIQRTTDGGDTWSRVEESSIPPILPYEWGGTNVYSAIGDVIWFASGIPDANGTYSSRCFKSVDRGQHWTVSPVIADNLGWYAIHFSSSQKGVFFDPGYNGPIQQFYYTTDGGSTWSKDSTTLTEPVYLGMSPVSGFDGGFVIAENAELGGLYSTKILFTPDFFNTIVVLDSNLQANPWGISFKDEMIGWLEGNGSNENAMHKFNGLLTSISDAVKSNGKIAILPNPTSTESLVKLPGLNEAGDMRLMIYNVAGKLLENKKIDNSSGWTKLNASAYSDGVYVVQAVSDGVTIASTKWVVKH